MVELAQPRVVEQLPRSWHPRIGPPQVAATAVGSPSGRIPLFPQAPSGQVTHPREPSPEPTAPEPVTVVAREVWAAMAATRFVAVMKERRCNWSGGFLFQEMRLVQSHWGNLNEWDGNANI